MDLPETLHDFLLVFLGSGIILGSLGVVLLTNPIFSAPTRLRRRCFSTERPRANYRDFGLSGHILREMVHEGLLPGATRSSW